MASRYYTSALTKVAGSSTQFTADIYLADASNVGEYMVELVVDGNPQPGVSYSYSAADVSGFSIAAYLGVAGMSINGGTFAAGGTIIGTVTVSFAVVPSAPFKLAVLSANLGDVYGNSMAVSWDAFAPFDPNTVNPPADTTPPIPPVVNAVAADNIVNAAEKAAGLTVTGIAEAGSSVLVTWGTTSKTVTAAGGIWSTSFSSAQVPADAASTTVSAVATDTAGNVSATATKVVLVDTLAPANPVINAVATDNIVNATEKATGVTVSGTAETGSSVLVSWGAVSKTVAAAGGNWSTSFSSAEVPADAASTTVSAVATDIAGNASAAGTKVVVVDAAAPTLSAASPADNASAVAVGSNIVLTFSESVALGTGNIVISNGADTRTISVTDANQVTMSGMQVTVNPTADLLAGSSYNVQMASGVIRDAVGNAFVGIPDPTTLNFAVQSASPPSTSVPRYSVTALTKVGNSNTQFSADVYLSNASNVSVYLVELQVDGNPSGVSYVYAASPVSGFGVAGGTAIGGVSDIGRSFAESGTKIGSVTVTFAVAPTASFKLAPSFTSLIDANNVMVSASWDAFALFDPNADTTPPIAPAINAVATDSIVNAAEKAAGVTVTGTAEAGSSVLVTWGTTSKTVTATGGAWSTSFSSSQVPADAASTTVSAVATDVAGNVSAAGTKAVTVDTAAPTNTVINSVATDSIVNAAEKSAGVIVSGTAETGSSVVVSWGAVSKTVAAAGGNWSTSFSSAEVPADAANTTISAIATDIAGNASAAGTKAVVVDAAAPTLSTASPSDNASAVAVGNNIVLTFSESVVVGTGNIVISNGADTRTISVTDSSQVTLSGTQVTINPTADLLAGGSYNVQMASGVIKDLAGNAYVGIADATTLNFGTASVTPTPTGAHYYATTPVRVAGSSTQFTADIYLAGASNVGAYGVELEVNGKPAGVSYSYTAATVSGFSASAGVGISAFSSSTTVGGTFATAGSLIGTITVSFAVAPTAAFKLAVKESNLDDIDLNPMTVSWDAFALYDPNTGNPPADTTPPIAPTLILASDTGTNTGDTITSSGVVNVTGLESGATWQYSTNAGSTWSAGTGNNFTLSGDGAKSVTVRQTDAAGNVGAASTALAFTLDSAAPTLASASPADNSTAVAVGNNIVLTFNESVAVGTGNIVISNGTDTRTISVTDTSQVTLSGTQVTINPTADLLASGSYNVQMASGVLKDVAGNVFAGINDATTLNFGTAGPSGGTGQTLDVMAYTWKNHTLLSGVTVAVGSTTKVTGADGSASLTSITDANVAMQATRAVPAGEATQTDSAVNLQDAIAILKMIVGLDVNGAGKALSPYQALAADYDGNGAVQLTDAIGVLKHVVGLTAPQPAWHFANEADVLVPLKANLTPGAAPAISVAVGAGSTPLHVGLVGYLSGDVDGSFAGAAGALDLDTLQSTYFNNLTSSQGLNPSQFGVYSV